MDFICLCVRIPKGGSRSLYQALLPAFAGRNIFYLPDTLNLDGRISRFQRWRFRKSQRKNLWKHYRVTRLEDAFCRINAEAKNGDLIAGGHADFPTARGQIAKPLKLITILRSPLARCLSEYNYMRRNYYKKSALTRFNNKLLRKAAGRHNFLGYLDFLLEHADVYGNIASTFVGWDGQEKLAGFFARNVFHSGVLEENEKFARTLSEKLGKNVVFPHQNLAEKFDDITIGSEERARIERLYAKDLELYEWQRKNP